MKRRYLLPLGLLATLPAFAQNAPPEHLMARYPAQWVAQQPTVDERLTVQRLLPPGQSPKDYNEAVVIERYDQDHTPPKEFIQARANDSRQNCDGTLSGQIDETLVNGYKSASIIYTCSKSHRNGKSGEVMVIAISGRDALHVISRVWIGPAVPANQLPPIPEQVTKEWTAFSSTVLLCDTRPNNNHPCPVSTAYPPGAGR